MGRKQEEGFTMVEMIVSVIVIALFMTTFYQIFRVNESQRVLLAQRTAADNIAQTNLNKITSVTGLPACGASNDLTVNANSTGSDVTFTAESTSGTSLPSGSATTQSLKVTYPRGCGANMPAKITSTVTFNSESVSHAAFVN